jgi:mannose-6-phosphate isomerase-like protein (cupin superfamily)
MPRAIRTVVTGHDEKGRSIFLSDEIAGPESPNVYIPKHDPNVCLTNIWTFDRVPADLDPSGTEARPFTLKPRTGGAIFRCLEIPPESMRRYDGIDKYFAGMDAGNALAQGEKKKHPAMHKTQTIDVLVILEGEIWLILDEGEVLLRQGDCIVQRATNHAWSNRTEKPCLLGLILVDAAAAA